MSPAPAPGKPYVRRRGSAGDCPRPTAPVGAEDRPGIVPGLRPRWEPGISREIAQIMKKRSIFVSVVIARIIKTYDLLDYRRNLNNSFFHDLRDNSFCATFIGYCRLKLQADNLTPTPTSTLDHFMTTFLTSRASRSSRRFHSLLFHHRTW